MATKTETVGRTCGRCKLPHPLAGGRMARRFWWVCANCSAELYDEERGLTRKGNGPEPILCPAQGLAAGYDPRFQVAPGTVVDGPFSRQWRALRGGKKS